MHYGSDSAKKTVLPKHLQQLMRRKVGVVDHMFLRGEENPGGRFALRKKVEVVIMNCCWS